MCDASSYVKEAMLSCGCVQSTGQRRRIFRGTAAADDKIQSPPPLKTLGPRRRESAAAVNMALLKIIDICGALKT